MGPGFAPPGPGSRTRTDVATPHRGIRRTAAAVAVLALALAAGSCADDATDGAGGGGGTGPTSTATSSPTTSARTPGTSSTVPATTLDVSPGGTLAIGDLMFSSPSRNISCYLATAAESEGGDSVRCDVFENSWELPPRPADCDLDWGPGVTLGATGDPQVVCAGDTVGQVPNVLPYGSSVRAGEITCTSERDGMTCRSAASGHGFTVSRAAYRFS